MSEKDKERFESIINNMNKLSEPKQERVAGIIQGLAMSEEEKETKSAMLHN